MKSASDVLIAMVLASATLLACRSAPKNDVHAEPAPPTECARCHTPEFNATTHPPHPNARPDTCGVCHTQSSWHSFRVEHPWWDLTGAHLRAAQDKSLAGKENQVKCLWCHRGESSTWKDTKKECVACHEEDRESAKVPGHDTFGVECQTCHTSESWKGAKRPAREPHMADAGPEHDAGGDRDASASSQPVAPKPRPTTAPAPRPTPAPTPRPDVHTGASRRH